MADTEPACRWRPTRGVRSRSQRDGGKKCFFVRTCLRERRMMIALGSTSKVNKTLSYPTSRGERYMPLKGVNGSRILVPGSMICVV